MASQNNLSNTNLPAEADTDLSAEELEEKQRLIKQILDLQNTLDALQHRVDSVREENLKLRQENGVLSQYIENLMATSTVFHSESPKIDKATRNSAARKK